MRGPVRACVPPKKKQHKKQGGPSPCPPPGGSGPAVPAETKDELEQLTADIKKMANSVRNKLKSERPRPRHGGVPGGAHGALMDGGGLAAGRHGEEHRAGRGALLRRPAHTQVPGEARGHRPCPPGWGCHPQALGSCLGTRLARVAPDPRLWVLSPVPVPRAPVRGPGPCGWDVLCPKCPHPDVPIPMSPSRCPHPNVPIPTSPPRCPTRSTRSCLGSSSM